ncbi:histidine kinase [Luteococcus sp. H138]|uniref:sensor histidine kinase n=1 Tax=unclassified Luteococcus TaxID=2639923 RepID=UPI00313B5155
MSLPDRLLGRTGPQRFDRATRASTAVFLLMGPFMALGGLAQINVVTPGWALVGSATLALFATVPAVASIWQALDVYLGRGAPHPRLIPGLHLMILLNLLWNALLLPTGGYGYGTPHAIAILAATAPASLLGCLLPARRLHAMMLALALFPPLISLARGMDARLVALTTPGPVLFSVLMAYTCRFSGWMLGVVSELEQARNLSARLAVAEERLRFSRDLHDVVGRSLSAIALKSQLAIELSRRERHERAQQEMTAVHALADEGLAEMRAVVAGYRKADLSAELAGARAMLVAAEVHPSVLGDDLVAALPSQAQEALGWVVREAVTNVVRHAQASFCTIALELGETVVLTVTNDGVGARGGSRSGSGLLGLAERLAPLGGSIRHGLVAGHFVVTVTLPVQHTSPLQEEFPG